MLGRPEFKMKVRLAPAQCPGCGDQLVQNKHNQKWCPNIGYNDGFYCGYGAGLILKQDLAELSIYG